MNPSIAAVAERPHRTRRRVVTAVTTLIVTAAGWAAPAQAATTTVGTRDELLTALAAAQAGDTVFVDGSAEIDLTGLRRIPIPAGVTLAGDRGHDGSPGALLYNTELGTVKETWAQFTTTGSGTRVTGLRLRGPDREIREGAYQYTNTDGIKAIDASDPLIDNNELSGWSHAAVSLADTAEGRVRGNHIHHNRRTGLGYGVVLEGDTSSVIEDNLFEHNRHTIAGSGLRTQRYDARFNVVASNPTGHSFDMHGENEALGNNQPYAGDVLHIDDNSFGEPAQKAVVIRGRPATVATVTGNCFARATQALSVEQKRTYADAPLGNLVIASNTYSTTPAACARDDRRVRWQLSAGGASSWTALAPYTFDASEVGFGDFDGDGRTDVFRAGGHRWFYSPGGAGPLVRGARADEQLAQLRFGDFDGDGTTDVFKTDGAQWFFASASTAGWRPLARSTTPLTALGFGDFDGDGRTDAFRTDGTRWFFSPGAAGNWKPLATSTAPLSSLRFGDFDGDGRTDVFTTSNGQWRYSSGGATTYVNLAYASEPLTALRFGDFDGDGRTDVFSSANGQWRYSSGGQAAWQPLAASGCPLSSLHVADDFTGDGRADVFGGRCGG
ncbi:FG-GAP-like repeat-containing protein [Actinoplanes sp. M2I2]|uniref:FG-GAP-like repeat-containing protein n=1 Tax=Actinoplanes sp. M2I2 TaxID=1734444 RepID=UPI0020207A5B|nr:FG-GAP-like repeat-containing protein [Actinoplanes sp. M2I2]